MSSKKSKKSTTSVSSRKEALFESDRKSNSTRILFILIVLAAVGAAGVLLLFQRNAPGTRAASTSSVQGDRILLPVNLFQDGIAKHYEISAGGVNIRYFVMRSSDGVIRAAFDACDVCWRSGKGYRQEGDDMVCNNCGQRFPSIRVNEVRGGCNPSPLEREIQGDQVIIRVPDLLQGKEYFDFQGKV